jgi:hypothetical protein
MLSNDPQCGSRLQKVRPPAAVRGVGSRAGSPALLLCVTVACSKDDLSTVSLGCDSSAAHGIAMLALVAAMIRRGTPSPRFVLQANHH